MRDGKPGRHEATEAALHRVAGVQRAGAGRGARQDDVARFQRHEVRDVGDEAGDGEDHAARAVVLHHLAVYVHPQPGVLGLRQGLFGYETANGTRRVEGLGQGPRPRSGPQPLQEGDVGHVQRKAVAAHVVAGPLLADPPARPADDHAQLHLGVHLVRG